MNNPDLQLASELDLNTLRVAVTFASTEETRYYLNGVCIEVEPFNVTYIATDGHRLFARKLFNADRNTLLGTFIVPRAICEAIKAEKRRKGQDVVRQRAAVTKNGAAFTLHYDATMLNFSMVDGTYPAWRNVIPPATDYGATANGAVCCNWQYMADFDKAAKALDLGKITLFPTKDHKGPMRVQFDLASNAIAVLMPMSGDKTLHEQKPWQAKGYSLDASEAA